MVSRDDLLVVSTPEQLLRSARPEDIVIREADSRVFTAVVTEADADIAFYVMGTPVRLTAERVTHDSRVLIVPAGERNMDPESGTPWIKPMAFGSRVLEVGVLPANSLLEPASVERITELAQQGSVWMAARDDNEGQMWEAVFGTTGTLGSYAPHRPRQFPGRGELTVAADALIRARRAGEDPSEHLVYLVTHDSVARRALSGEARVLSDVALRDVVIAGADFGVSIEGVRWYRSLV